MDPARRRSLIVTLTGVGVGGALILTAFVPEGKEFRNNEYRSQRDCERDYSPGQCRPPSGGGGGGGAGGYWRGPTYVTNRTLPEARTDPGPGRQGGLAVKFETSVRGGFGKVGAFMRAVG